MDDAQLESVLDESQALHAQLGALRTDMRVQVAKGVDERRVARILAIAHDAHFVSVTRFSDIDWVDHAGRERVAGAAR